MADEMNESTPTVKNATSKIKAMAKSAGDVQGQVQEQVSEVTERAMNAVKEFDSSPVSYIRENPILAAVGGIVLGFILGTAISRRSVR